MKTTNLIKNINTQFGGTCNGCKNFIKEPEYKCSKKHKIFMKNNIPVTYCTGCYELKNGLATNDWMF